MHALQMGMNVHKTLVGSLEGLELAGGSDGRGLLELRLSIGM
jgi:hypothetical protein